MNIALIGYGRMGHAVEAEALLAGHTIIARVDTSAQLQASAAQLASADVAIEFTEPSSAVANIEFCLSHALPIVCGTTGWYAGDAYSRIVSQCNDCGGRLLAATNFSIGMNIMFALNERLAQLMHSRPEYSPSIREVHHIHKLDAPSGTAITLQQQLEQHLPGGAIPIESVREGEVPGIHTVSFRSDADTISITHEAHGRRGLAQGAVLAAEWLAAAAPGVYSMKDVLNV